MPALEPSGAQAAPAIRAREGMTRAVRLYRFGGALRVGQPESAYRQSLPGGFDRPGRGMQAGALAGERQDLVAWCAFGKFTLVLGWSACFMRMFVEGSGLVFKRFSA